MRSRPRLSVRMALTAWYLLVLGLVIAGFSAALYWDQERTLAAQVDRSLAGASGQAKALIDKHVEPIRFVDNDAYRHASSYLAQTGYAVMLMGLSPLAPHVLWNLVMVAGIVLALTTSLSAIFERVLRKAVAEGRVPR